MTTSTRQLLTSATRWVAGVAVFVSVTLAAIWISLWEGSLIGDPAGGVHITGAVLLLMFMACAVTFGGGRDTSTPDWSDTYSTARKTATTGTSFTSEGVSQ